jgi:hypothetical protein
MQLQVRLKNVELSMMIKIVKTALREWGSFARKLRPQFIVDPLRKKGYNINIVEYRYVDRRHWSAP